MLANVWTRLKSRYDGKLAGRLQAGLPLICRAWLLLSLGAVLMRTIFSPGAWMPASMLTTLALAAPAIVLLAVLRYYQPSAFFAQPPTRLARLGRWRQLDNLSARDFQQYGTAGLLTMLLGGLLLNVPVRAAEFLVAMPIPRPDAPSWYLTFYGLMLIDLALLCSCYAGLVGLAVRKVPHFPRLLVATWLLDIAAQLVIGGTMAVVSNVPASVMGQLPTLLHGNIEKVGISVAIWLPYLLLSQRVNLTFRHRIPAYSFKNLKRS